jgi:alpha-tubulin suppressor-like RCC1 family protein
VGAAGQYHTCGVTLGNVAYCWGLNSEGQLGDGTTTTRLTPVAVAVSDINPDGVQEPDGDKSQVSVDEPDGDAEQE